MKRFRISYLFFNLDIGIVVGSFRHSDDIYIGIYVDLSVEQPGEPVRKAARYLIFDHRLRRLCFVGARVSMLDGGFSEANNNSSKTTSLVSEESCSIEDPGRLSVLMIMTDAISIIITIHNLMAIILLPPQFVPNWFYRVPILWNDYNTFRRVRCIIC